MARAELVFAFGWEDPELVVDTLRGRGASRVLVADRAGELSLALCDAGFEVHSQPPDEGAAALVALKHAALEDLPPQSRRSLLGLADFGRRVWFYHHLRGRLPEPARRWWDAHEDVVRRGIAGAGSVERSREAWRRTLGALALGDGRLDALRQSEEPEARRRWWAGLGAARARALTLPFLPTVVGIAYRLAAGPTERPPDPARALLAIVGGYPFERSLHLEQAWTGNWRDPAGGPTWLDRGRVKGAPAVSGAVHLHPPGTDPPPGPYDAVVLGDEPERWPAAERADRLARFIRVLAPGGSLLGWERLGRWPVGPELHPEAAEGAWLDRTLPPARFRAWRRA